MTLLSVNVNKVALIRNSRGDDNPDLIDFVRLAIGAGAAGITVHPRIDGRHVKFSDVTAIASIEEIRSGKVEFNIEGDLRDDLLQLVEDTMPTQFTVVPVERGEITSGRGWRVHDNQRSLIEVCQRFNTRIRTVVFCDPDVQSVQLASDAGARGVELYTGPFAASVGSAKIDLEIERLRCAAHEAKKRGMRLNGGHDLNRENLGILLDAIEFDELSIGHAVFVNALSHGWANTVTQYAKILG